MLTRAGAALVVGSLLLGVAGRLFGVIELTVAGACGLGLALMAVVTVHWRPPRIAVERQIHPARVNAGTASRVELALTNMGPSTSPVVGLADTVTGTTGAHLLVGPLQSRARISATYRLPTDRRGLVDIGPLTIEQSDPFGLCRRVENHDLRAQLTVLPRVVDLLPLPYSLGHEPLAGAGLPDHLGRASDDFYALRPYVVGDDLRRVHWSSTARHGDLLVRQDEQPWQGRVTVVLDNRRMGPASAEDPRFELMVTAAASIVAAARRRGDVVRLRTTSGFDTGFVTGRAQIDTLMEHLAVVDVTTPGPWPAGLATATRGSSLVAVVSDINQADLDAMVDSRRRAGGLTVLRLAGGSHRAPLTVTPEILRRGLVRFVDVADGNQLASSWNAAMTKRWNA